MSRLLADSVEVLNVSEGTGVQCPIEWQKAERAIIRLKVNGRDPSVGTSDYEKIIPREYCGYYYLYKDNYLMERGTIDFKSMEIYNDKQIWFAEVFTQSMAQRVPLIETTQPEENVEEISELLLVSGNILSGLISSLDVPFISDLLSFVTGFFENLSSDDLQYLPMPYRPDMLYVWFPPGKVDLNIEFLWYPYSPIAFGAGIAEIDITQEIQLPDNQDADDPTAPAPAINFDKLARDNGYILPSDCPVPPPVPNPWDGGNCDNVSYRVRLLGDVFFTSGVYVDTMSLTVSNVTGAVYGFRISDNKKQIIVLAKGGEYPATTLSSPSQEFRGGRITSVTRMDGAPDVC